MAGFLPRDLIREIKCRPGIYDRSVLESPQRDQRHQLWQEVAENLTPAEDWEQYTEVEKVARIDEIQAKWKHLRGHFHRELKLIDAGEAHKKRKYVYFDDMSFMRPFVGFNLPRLKLEEEVSLKTMDTTEDEPKFEDNVEPVTDEPKFEDNVDPVTDVDMDALLQSGDSVEEDEKDDSPVDIPKLRPRRNIKPLTNIKQEQSPTALKSSSKQHRDVFKKSTTSVPSNDRLAATTGNPNFKVRDGDITFSLSLVPTLRKMNDSKKLRAKIEILKVLHKYTELVMAEQRNKKRSQGKVENNSETNIQEDNLEFYEENNDEVSVKNEEHDPLNGTTKTWWT